VRAAGRQLELVERLGPRHRPDRLGADGAQERRPLQVEPRRVEHQAADPLLPAAPLRGELLVAPVRPEREDQSTGRVGREQHPLPGLGGDDLQRPVELVVVEREVGDVVRGLTTPPGPPTLAQVECIERIAPLGEEVGELPLEEVVTEAVHVEDGAAHPLPRTYRSADQGRLDLALAVGIDAEVEGPALVAVEDVGVPRRCGAHAGTLASRPRREPATSTMIPTARTVTPSSACADSRSPSTRTPSSVAVTGSASVRVATVAAGSSARPAPKKR